jgi:two-component system, OmpR family, alkaline phosphatase synthesis response regulator PhoP
MAKATILVIEDDPDIRELLSFSLAKEGWTIVAAGDGESGMAKLGSANPDCIVLDIMLPGMDGLEVLKALKAEPARRRLPVIMTTAKGEEADIVAGLELGADDYVVKPYSPRVLAARIRAALRKSYEARALASSGDAILAKGDITLDPGKHEVKVKDKRVDLSATEFSILELLIRNPGWVFSRSRIIDSVKGRDYPVTDRAVDVQILALRRKLGENGDDIETVRGVGYRLKD